MPDEEAKRMEESIKAMQKIQRKAKEEGERIREKRVSPLASKKE